ncbi:hypothetical protein [Acinetobacter sp. YH16032]|uniref:hypothetical protein n=1 Tax=Acinetobacter sp. YH16032 TaxID=2601181 RepID=UPI0015D312BE|nr:hypothetical protein [Acinetobacter sp. YH16032]
MNQINTLILTTAALISTNSFAFEELSDQELSTYAAQDGITISLLPGGPIQADLIWHDNSGFGPDYNEGNTKAGALIFGTANGRSKNPLSLSSGSADISITLKIDAQGGSSTSGPFLNLGVFVPEDIIINTGDIWVGKSGQVSPTGRGYSDPVKIMDNMKFYISNLSTNIQLGSAAQGSLLKLNGIFKDGLRLEGFKVHDHDGGGAFGIEFINLKNTQPGRFGINNLDFDVAGSIRTDGLELKINRLGDQNGFNAMLWGVGVGDASTINNKIGDISMKGINLNGTTIKVSAH